MAKPARRRKRSTMPLPPEICAMICEDVGPKDLVTLCRTSRLFGDQAQRLIYRKINLSYCTPSALRSWCLAVTRRSQLAERVHALSLGLPGDLSFSSDVGKISRALSRCINLKELIIHPDNCGPFGPRYESASSSIQGWIITKCPFRLTKFSNSFFRTSFLAQFWTPQSDIRVLSIPLCTDHFPVFDDQLPNLIALEVMNVKAFPTNRALQRIQLRWSRRPGNLDALSALRRYSTSLTTLNLIQDDLVQSISTLQVIDKVARELPNLLHLGMAESNSEYVKVAERFSEGSPISALTKFTQLQTFVIYCEKITGFDDPALERVYELDEIPGLHTFVEAIMKASSTLQRVVVGVRTPFGGRYPGSHKLDTTCTLTRSSKGRLKMDTHSPSI